MNDYDLAQTLSPSLCPPPLLPLTATTLPPTTTRPEVVKTLAPGNINHGQSLVLQPVQHLVHGLSIEIQGTDTEVLAKELGGLRCKKISS